MENGLQILGPQCERLKREDEEFHATFQLVVAFLLSKIRRLEGYSDGSEQKGLDPYEPFLKTQIWRVMAEEDAKLGGQRHIPMPKSTWNEALQKLEKENRVDRDKGGRDVSLIDSAD